MGTARETALKILYLTEFEGAYSNLALKNQNKEKDARDRALVTQLVYGVISRKITLDAVISKYSSVKLKKLSKYVLLILRLGIYQLMYCDKIPHSAAINESVKLANKYAVKSKGFINGILRAVERGKYEFQSKAEELSYPEWIYEKWLEELGEKKAECVMEALNSAPKMTIRVNLLKNTREELIKKLKDEGIEAEEDPVSPQGIKVSGVNIMQSEAFLRGAFTVQDTAAQLAVMALSPKSGACVLDLCAAPGGKTTHMAEIMDNSGEIVAIDVHEHKIQLIEEAAERLGIDIIKTVCFDASERTKALENRFDCVLADVPCSGLGIIRRKPEIKYNARPGAELYALQKKILDCAATYVKKDGVIVYSTCTLNKYENELRIKSFLDENKNFELSDLGNALNVEACKEGYCVLYPDELDADGFFIAKLKRIK